jgi:purine-cytosine permease-like protein
LRYALLIHVCRRQMVLSRFWFGWYGVKLSKLVRPIDWAILTK